MTALDSERQNDIVRLPGEVENDPVFLKANERADMHFSGERKKMTGELDTRHRVAVRRSDASNGISIKKWYDFKQIIPNE